VSNRHGRLSRSHHSRTGCSSVSAESWRCFLLVSSHLMGVFIILSFTDPKLFRALLSPPNHTTDEPKGKDPSKMSLVDRLCTYLSDTSRQSKDVYVTVFTVWLTCKLPSTQGWRHANIASILAFIAMVSISDADPCPTLTLIACLVLLLTSPIWEDDGSLTTSLTTTTAS
jgi:hypothetical protein